MTNNRPIDAEEQPRGLVARAFKLLDRASAWRLTDDEGVGPVVATIAVVLLLAAVLAADLVAAVCGWLGW